MGIKMKHETIENCKLYNGDCLEVMPQLEAGSVDMVLTDPPYGTTQNKWDCVIPFVPMWENLKKLIKPKGVIALTSQSLFYS